MKNNRIEKKNVTKSVPNGCQTTEEAGPKNMANLAGTNLLQSNP